VNAASTFPVQDPVKGNMPTCRICGSENQQREYGARERMFGTGEAFPYFQCAHCECLQITTIPEDLSRHYPEGYYSFRWKDSGRSRPSQSEIAKSALWTRFAFGFLSILAPFISVPGFVRLWRKRASIELSAKILDVGCGQGRYLHEFARMGFTSLTGIDPFVPQDTSHPDGVNIFRKELSAMQGLFDFIMLHHSFEHMPEPLATLKEIHRLLQPGKLALIRIPLSSSFAWKKYSSHWVSLDAPRHLYLHSRASMEWLARAAGFTIATVDYDSTDFQFWGSEQYMRDIPLFATNSYAEDRRASIFSPRQIKAFEARAVGLNIIRRGDQACFFLRKT
jgi:SAM-dependent methyltransferase